MMDNDKIGIAIFQQICEVNDLDPEKIRNIAQKQQPSSQKNADEAEHLIRTAFNYRAKALAKKLELGYTSDSESIEEGEEYTISADPAAPSFTVNEDFIKGKYSEDEAQRLIEALGHVMLPIRA